MEARPWLELLRQRGALELDAQEGLEDQRPLPERGQPPEHAAEFEVRRPQARP